VAIFPRVRFGAVQYLILVCAVLQCLTQIKMRQPMTAGARLIVIFARNVGNGILTRCATQQLMNAASDHKFSSWPFKWLGLTVAHLLCRIPRVPAPRPVD